VATTIKIRVLGRRKLTIRKEPANMHYRAKKVYPGDIKSSWYAIVGTGGVRIADVEGQYYAEYIAKCLNHKIDIVEWFDRDKPKKIEPIKPEDRQVSKLVGKDFLRKKYGEFFK
jgi:hypothetical protein